MKRALILVLLLCSMSAYSCTKYTEEQVNLINAAYQVGLPRNYGYTLAGITVKESFVGNKVVRMNPSDPSFGITHIHLNTIRDISKKGYYESVLEAELLVFDDVLSWEYSMKKLDTIKGTWFNKWRRYNGAGVAAERYAKDVQNIIADIKKCKVLR